MEIHDNISNALANPNFIQLDANLYVASFVLMKILPAKFILENALKSGRISKRTLIVETSSGTFALSLGLVCRELGLKFCIIGDAAIETDLQNQLRLLGGEVEIIKEQKNEGIQVSRLKRLNEIRQSIPNTFCPSQYDNPDILLSYKYFASQLARNFGSDFTLVAPVGSGGVSCGTATFLRMQSCNVELIGVDTFGSILFGLESRTRTLRGLGNSILPKILNHSLFDQIHWLTSHVAFPSAKKLFETKALFSGPTTGACYQVGKWIAERDPRKKVVIISADQGHRYTSTVYNEDWMHRNAYVEKNSSLSPIQVYHPDEVNSMKADWCFFNWDRRTLKSVLSEKSRGHV